ERAGSSVLVTLSLHDALPILSGLYHRRLEDHEQQLARRARPGLAAIVLVVPRRAQGDGADAPAARADAVHDASASACQDAARLDGDDAVSSAVRDVDLRSAAGHDGEPGGHHGIERASADAGKLSESVRAESHV